MSIIEIGWLSKNSLARHRPVFMAAQVSLFLIGCVFWVDVQTGGDNFAPEIWGHFACSLPAEAWAAINMTASAICYIGLGKPIRNWQVIVGSSLHCLQFSVLSWSAVFDGGAAVIGLYASMLLLPLHLWLLIEAIFHAPGFATKNA